MSATLKLLYLITVKSELNKKLTEWTEWQDERQQRAMRSPLLAALWIPKCTTQRLCRSSARPWATEKMYEDGLMSSYTHSEKPSNNISNLLIKCEKRPVFFSQTLCLQNTTVMRVNEMSECAQWSSWLKIWHIQDMKQWPAHVLFPWLVMVTIPLIQAWLGVAFLS